MKLILISKRSDRVRTLSLNSWARILLSTAVLGIPVAAGTLLGLKIADGRWQLLFEDHIAEMQNELTISRLHSSSLDYMKNKILLILNLNNFPIF